MKETGSKEDFQNYKRAQQQAKKVVRNAQKSMRKILSVGPLKNGNSDTIDNYEVCKVLNKFFCISFHNR